MPANWKTTAAGLAAAVCAFVVLDPADLHAPPLLVAICKFILSGGLAALGIQAKDSGAAPQAEDKAQERTNQ